MKKIKLLSSLLIVSALSITAVNYFSKSENDQKQAKTDVIPFSKKAKKKKKTIEEKRRSVEERINYERKLQINPKTGEIPLEDKQIELKISQEIMAKSLRNNAKNASNTTYISRGPSNLGGRTRGLVIDRSDATSNTMIAGGVSSGVFRTTNGGTTWTKVSANNEIHNATTIVQDPRTGLESIWYYGTGEFAGNSAGGGGATYLGRGVWQSTDGGLNWTQVAGTDSVQESDDSNFDIIHKLAVHPVSGHVFAATRGAIQRFDGTNWTTELNANGNFFTDVTITSTGIVYAGFAGNSGASFEGVWQSPNGQGSWTRVGSNQDDSLGSIGRLVLAVAPSNEDIVYAFFHSSNVNEAIQAGIYQYNNSNDTWTNYSSKMPDEAGGNSRGNDPIAVQGGYDLVVSVKPDNENFVVIGGTNAYKIQDITTDAMFTRIGGYRDNTGYALYNLGGGDDHHPDIHSLVFDTTNNNVLFSGTDGGVHKTNDITAATVSWTSINNNYQTYQYYHVAIDPQNGSDLVLGGAQDNGTTGGGTELNNVNLTGITSALINITDQTTAASIFGGDGVAVSISRDNACVPLYLGAQNGFLVRSCPTAANITPENSQSQFVTYFFLDPSNNNALYYAGRTNIYTTNNASNVTQLNWNNLGTIASGSNGGDAQEWVSQYATNWGAYSAASSYLLIGGDSGTVLRLSDPQNATDLTNAVDITPPGVARTYPTVVSGLAIHPSNPDVAMVTYSNYGIPSIFITSNATATTPTWTQVESNLSAFSIRSAAIAEVNGQTQYYVGTARGLYTTLDPGNEDWTIESPDQIGFAVASSLAYRPSDNKLLVGTHGNGMYEGTVQEVLSVDEFDTSKNPFVAYPIPATEVINVVIEDSFVPGDLTYSVIDLTGKTIKTGELNAEKQIRVEELTNGLYVLQLASNNASKAITFVKK